MISKSRMLFILAVLFSAVVGDPVILDPPKCPDSATSGCKSVAVIWIHGLECPPGAYTSLATMFQ